MLVVLVYSGLLGGTLGEYSYVAKVLNYAPQPRLEKNWLHFRRTIFGYPPSLYFAALCSRMQHTKT
jgi:hypothetical protein